MINAYLRLMRFDKPIGIWLLLWPCYWALWLASEHGPSLNNWFLFTLGVIIMRAAGCVINDIADRHVDRYVERTAQRPLTSGSVSLPGAVINVVMLLFFALIILLQLPQHCFIWALPALALTIVYPLTKRYFDAPQLVLGLAFSWSIPMVFVASSQLLSINVAILMLINITWTFSYDTLYAMVDKKDDLKVGIRSSAILLGDFDKLVLSILHGVIQTLWLVLAGLDSLPFVFYLFWFAGCGVLIYQHILINKEPENSQYCFQAFKINHWYGMCMWLGLVAAVNFTH